MDLFCPYSSNLRALARSCPDRDNGQIADENRGYQTIPGSLSRNDYSRMTTNSLQARPLQRGHTNSTWVEDVTAGMGFIQFEPNCILCPICLRHPTSYDETPACGNFISQYKNLFHHHIKTLAARSRHSDEERYQRPSAEDIELGIRMTAAKHRIILDPCIKAKHLKRWTLWNLLTTDVLDRGVPWTRMMRDPRTMGLRYLHDDVITRPRFWDYMNQAGMHVGVVNVLEVHLSRPLNMFQLATRGAHAARTPPASTPPSLSGEVNLRIGRHPVGQWLPAKLSGGL